MSLNRKQLSYPDNYYLVNTETRTIIHDTNIMPANVMQSNSIDFIYACDHSYINLTIEDSDITHDMREGKWILDFPRNEINTAWEKMKESVRVGKLWMCKVTPINECSTHRLWVSIPNCTHIPTLLETYNHLVNLGLVNSAQPPLLKSSHAFINNEQVNDCRADQLPKLVLKYLENGGYDKKLLFLMLQYLRNQIAELNYQTTSHQFIMALRQLSKELNNDIQNGNESQQLISIKIAAETSCMLMNLQKHSREVHCHHKMLIRPQNDSEEAINSFFEKKIKNEEKINIIQNYENNCRQLSGVEKLMRTIATVIMTGVGMILGAAIGTGIGAAFGIVSGGPCAAITTSVGALAGLIKGTLTGYAVGLAAGSLLAGIATGSAYRHLFFQPSKQEKLVNLVAKEARHHYTL